ncbi:MAG: hypothetical protein ACLU38_15660 [Dysosmobacter sp.]
MEHWDRLRGDQGFYWDDGLFRPSTDTFPVGGLSRPAPWGTGLRLRSQDKGCWGRCC